MGWMEDGARGVSRSVCVKIMLAGIGKISRFPAGSCGQFCRPATAGGIINFSSIPSTPCLSYPFSHPPAARADEDENRATEVMFPGIPGAGWSSGAAGWLSKGSRERVTVK